MAVIIMMSMHVIVAVIVRGTVIMMVAMSSHRQVHMRVMIILHSFKLVYMDIRSRLVQMLVFVRMEMYVNMFVPFRPVHVTVGMKKRSDDAPVFGVHGARAQFFVQELVRHECQGQLQVISFE